MSQSQRGNGRNGREPGLRHASKPLDDATIARKVQRDLP